MKRSKAPRAKSKRRKGRYIVRVTLKTCEPVGKTYARTWVQAALNMQADANSGPVVAAKASVVDEQ